MLEAFDRLKKNIFSAGLVGATVEIFGGAYVIFLITLTLTFTLISVSEILVALVAFSAYKPWFLVHSANHSLKI